MENNNLDESNNESKEKKKQKGVAISSTECDASPAPQKAFCTSTKTHNENENVADSVAFVKNLDPAIKIEPHDAIFNEEPIAIKDEIVKYEVLEFGENEESCIASPGIESLADQQQIDTEEILCSSVVSDETCIDEEFISNAASAQNHGRTQIQAEDLHTQRKVSKHSLDKNVNRPFKCPQCPKDFATKYALRTHSKIHTDRQRPYQCDVCDKAFLKQHTLNEHRKMHSDEKLFACEICSKAFSRQHNLLAHKIIHSGDKPFICSICGRAFARKREMKDHERIHTGERPYKCDTCEITFKQRSNLTSHIKAAHLQEKLHRCKHCERKFKRRCLLHYHMQSAHTGECAHKCVICGAAFVYPTHLKKHMIVHSGTKQFACEICGIHFGSRHYRDTHRFTHSDKNLFECLECGAGFMRKQHFLAHIRKTKHSNDTIILNQPQISSSNGENGGETECTFATAENGNTNEVVTGVNERLIKCEIGEVKYLKYTCGTCGKSFARKREFKDHERIHTRSFKCDSCEMTFKKRFKLTSHVKSAHPNVEVHRCKYCERKFNRRCLLLRHIQSDHTVECSHKCMVCSAAFVYPVHYKNHMRIHSKQFACEICNIPFNSRHYLNAHRFTHSHKNPYECLECGEGFMRKPHLMEHIKETKHSNDTIILIKPQISLNNGETAGKNVDMVEETECTLTTAENGNTNETITGVNEQLIKCEIGEVKYLEFAEHSFTWEDVGDKVS